MIEEEKAEAIKNQMIAASFTAWQLEAGGKMGFAEYLRQLGLSDSEPKLTEDQKEILTSRGLDVADRINAAVKAGRVA